MVIAKKLRYLVQYKNHDKKHGLQSPSRKEAPQKRPGASRTSWPGRTLPEDRQADRVPTLQENGFESLSTATIRNYFSKMEETGYLKQQHTSGGRIPTEKAFRLYADTHKNQGCVEEGQEEILDEALKSENREIATLINRSADVLSEMTNCAVFVSDAPLRSRLCPRYPADRTRLFETLVRPHHRFRPYPHRNHLSRTSGRSFLLAKREEYFLWRMNKGEKPLFRDEAEAKLAQRIYNEMMVRHVVGYANFSHEDILRAGLSKLLAYPEFNDAAALARASRFWKTKPRCEPSFENAARKTS